MTKLNKSVLSILQVMNIYLSISSYKFQILVLSIIGMWLAHGVLVRKIKNSGVKVKEW